MDDELTDQIAAILENYHPMSRRSASLISDRACLLELDRDEELIRQGEPDPSEYFILEGTLHRYVIDSEGERVTSAFHLAGTVITPHFSRTVEGRSKFNLQALVPSKLAALPVKELDRLRYSHEELRVFGLKVVERELIGSIQQSIAFRERSARERLIAFRAEYPGLENMIAHTTIASYLGITPVSFSRLRKELSREN